MLGVPMEVITMLGSGILSGVMSLWSKSMESKQRSHERQMELLSAKTVAVEKAREFQNHGFMITRRIIALMAVFSIVLLPKLAVVFGLPWQVTVGWTEVDPGALFGLFPEQEVVKWKTAQGFVITPLDTHLVSAIIGLYFGNVMTKR